MQIDKLADQKVLVLGFGREGQATLKFLLNRWPEISVGVADMREFPELSAEEQALVHDLDSSARRFGPDYLNNLSDFDVIIKSPGINPRKKEIHEAVSKGVILTSATNIFFAFKKGRVVAVTGSKGKSTTASLIYAVLKAGGYDAELIGNIGSAALEYLADDTSEKVYVYEMSSYQLEDFQGGAEYAVFVSFFPDHLDYHGDIDKYFEAKIKLAAQPVPGMKIVYNWQSERLRKYFDDYGRAFKDDVELIQFNNSVDSRVEEISGRLCAVLDDHEVACSNEIQLKGKHNLENILAVAAVARLFDIEDETLIAALRDFPPLEHRLEYVGTFQEISFFNDAISTTPESTIAALEALSAESKIGTLIVGGMDRGYEFDELAQQIVQYKIDTLILLPDTGTRIAEAVKKAGGKNSPRMIPCSDMLSTVKHAYKVTPPGAICLLSCASPSYNLFKNFEDRGRQFKRAVHDLATGKK